MSEKQSLASDAGPAGRGRSLDDPWDAHGGLLLRPADAGECGWPVAFAGACFESLFPGREAVSAREVGALVSDLRGLVEALAPSLPADLEDGGPGAEPCSLAERRAAAELFRELARDLLEYRVERARTVPLYDAIRFTKINLKRVALGDFSPAQLRSVATELGCTVREDEEGVTVAVEDLLPFFRRPVVRRLLDRKLELCGLPAPGSRPRSG